MTEIICPRQSGQLSSRSMYSSPCLVGFTGPSGVGKTSLLESVIAELDRRGLAVGVVKHSSHSVVTDRPGKDSYRLYHSGAAAVALTMPDQVATFSRRDGASPRLADAIATLPEGLDVILVEGYLSEPIPRYVLLPHDHPAPGRYLESHHVLRVIDVPAPPANAPPSFSAELVAELATEIETLPNSSDRTLVAAKPGAYGSGG